jgi:hypothetical protein
MRHEVKEESWPVMPLVAGRRATQPLTKIGRLTVTVKCAAPQLARVAAAAESAVAAVAGLSLASLAARRGSSAAGQ